MFWSAKASNHSNKFDMRAYQLLTKIVNRLCCNAFGFCDRFPVGAAGSTNRPDTSRNLSKYHISKILSSTLRKTIFLGRWKNSFSPELDKTL